MKNTRVALLDGGEMYAKEYQVFWNLPSEARIVLPSFGVLIDHADGMYLFDTGFDLHFFETLSGSSDYARQSIDQTIPGQISLLGLTTDDVNYVINSHYHFDHCGGNRHFPGATTLCHACELDALNAPQAFEARLYSDQSFTDGLSGERPEESPLDVYTRRAETLTGDQEIARGLHLLETPGHTAGHYSLLVELSDRRPMLFPGDACYSGRGLDMMRMPSQHVDPVAGYRSLERIKAVAEKYDAEIFFSHDQENYPTYHKAPYWYR